MHSQIWLRTHLVDYAAVPVSTISAVDVKVLPHKVAEAGADQDFGEAGEPREPPASRYQPALHSCVEPAAAGNYAGDGLYILELEVWRQDLENVVPYCRYWNLILNLKAAQWYFFKTSN